MCTCKRFVPLDDLRRVTYLWDFEDICFRPAPICCSIVQHCSVVQSSFAALRPCLTVGQAWWEGHVHDWSWGLHQCDQNRQHGCNWNPVWGLCLVIPSLTMDHSCIQIQPHQRAQHCSLMWHGSRAIEKSYTFRQGRHECILLPWFHWTHSSQVRNLELQLGGHFSLSELKSLQKLQVQSTATLALWTTDFHYTALSYVHDMKYSCWRAMSLSDLCCSYCVLYKTALHRYGLRDRKYYYIYHVLFGARWYGCCATGLGTLKAALSQLKLLLYSHVALWCW